MFRLTTFSVGSRYISSAVVSLVIGSIFTLPCPINPVVGAAAIAAFAGLLLIIAEMRLNMCHERLSGNCGFLFSYNFRVLYILLSGTLCFSMECSQYVYVGYIAGSVSIMNAIFSCFMISNHPGMVQLTGHDDIDNARLLSNYGIGNRRMLLLKYIHKHKLKKK